MKRIGISKATIQTSQKESQKRPLLRQIITFHIPTYKRLLKVSKKQSLIFQVLLIRLYLLGNVQICVARKLFFFFVGWLV